MTGKEIYEIVKREFPDDREYNIHVTKKFSMWYTEDGYITCYKRGWKYSFSYYHNHNLLSIGIL